MADAEKPETARRDRGADWTKTRVGVTIYFIGLAVVVLTLLSD